MLRVFLPVLLATAACAQKDDLASKQLVYYKCNANNTGGILTTFAGAPVSVKEATNTVNSDLLNNEYLIDMCQHTVRRTIPERPLHASGVGAFGYFETTHDISHICKADLFSEVGKKTPVGVRFSLSFASIGASDSKRESRGMAMKFYTKAGNWDLTGVNFPNFAFKDPSLFPSLIRVFQRNSATNLPDHNAIWDFVAHRPESINEILQILSHRGMPAGYCHMESWACHTYQVYNAKGESTFLRFHLAPEQGVKYLNKTEISNAAKDPDYFARDLYNRVAGGEKPSWKLQIQIVPKKVAIERQMDIFDITQGLPVEEFKWHDVGRLVLLKNPSNHFKDVEQMAFSPGNCVPGILGGCDKAFQSRRFIYRDSAIGRLGSNFKRISVNAPLQNINSYARDGVAPVGDNGGSAPNYLFNSFGGVAPYEDSVKPELLKIHESPEVRNYKQVSDFYSKSLNAKERDILIENIVEHMCYCEKNIKKAVVQRFKKINSDLGTRVAKALAAECGY